jgi:hypothetical protein
MHSALNCIIEIIYSTWDKFDRECYGSDSQLVTFGHGGFIITQSKTPNAFTTSFSGDCMYASDLHATGTISAGQQLTCTSHT